MRHPDMNWRTMSALDLRAVEAIAAVVHKDFYESPEVLAERVALYPFGAHLLEIGERPVGYVLSHPWTAGVVPALNSLLGALPADPDTYYLHDLALLPVARRIGAGGMMVEALTRHAEARGLRQMSLVAVHGSASFWRRHDFLPVDVPELAGKLLSYDADALYMVRRLDPPGD
jgi:ribosomal protein S18 acetylase RimI-like enzyme